MLNLLTRAHQAHLQAEIWHQHEDEATVNFVMNQFKAAKHLSSTGYGLRLISNGKLGFSSSTRMDAKLWHRALESMPYGPEIHFDFAPQGRIKTSLNLQTYDPAIRRLSFKTLERLGSQLLEAIRAFPGIDCDLSVRKSLINTRVANRYQDLTANRSYFGIAAVAHSIKDGDFLQVYESQDSCCWEPKPELLARAIILKLNWARKLVRLKSGRLPVIFTPKALPTLLAAFLTGINGHILMKGTSPLIQKLGTQIMDSNISIKDDPHIKKAIGSAEFDAEGIPTSSKYLIQCGILRNWITDLHSAALLNLKPSGNAHRSYNRLPHPAIFNLTVSGGEHSYKAILAGLNEGLIVDQVIGGHTGNFLAGDFALNVDLGFYVKKGEIAGRVKNTMVSGNIYNVFRQVAQLSQERAWNENFLLPYIQFENLHLASKDN